MSDYGFATYDEYKKDKRTGSVNSKWPIFGPEYKNIKKCFKTFHIIDLKTQPYITASLPVPPGTGTNQDKGCKKQLILKREHKLGYKPIGYATITGEVRQTIRGIFEYTLVSNVQEYFPPSFTKYETLVRQTRLVSNAMYSMQADGNVMSLGGSIFTSMGMATAAEGYPEPFAPGAVIFHIPERVYGPVGTPYTNFWSDGDPYQPYTVEFDETYIYVYRNVFWGDTLMRYFEVTQVGNVDLRSRAKAVTSYDGSEVDVTVYFLPNKREDYLI